MSNNIIKLEQKDHYSLANKYIGQKKLLIGSRESQQINKDVRTLVNQYSRTTQQNNNSTTISSSFHQNSLLPQTPINQHQIRGSYTNINNVSNNHHNSISNNFTKIELDSSQRNKYLRNTSVQQQHSGNNLYNHASKQIQHRRLKQDESLSKNISQQKQSQSCFTQQQQQYQQQQNKDYIEKPLALLQRDQTNTPLNQVKQQFKSLKSIHYLDGGATSQRSLLSTMVAPSIKNMSSNNNSNAHFFNAMAKNSQKSLTNLDSGINSKRVVQSEIFSNSQIGSLTNLNDNFSQKFDWIDKIEGKQFMSATTFDPTEIYKLNTQKKQKKQDVNIISNKTINSAQIQDGIQNILRCEINEFLYFKIKIFEKESPLRVKFIVEKNQSNLKLYVSRQCIQPNNFNCDFVYNNTKIICIEEEKNQSQFKKHNFLYFSIVSDIEQDIQLKYTFGQDQKKPKININQRSSLAHIPNIENISSMSTVQLRQSIQDIHSEKKQQMNENGNFIKKNIEVTQNIDQFTKCLTAYTKKRETFNQLLTVIEKAQNLKQAKQDAIEKEQNSKLRKQIDKIQKFRLQFFQYFWIQIIQLIKITSEINDRYKEKKDAIQIFSKIAWNALPLKNKFKRFRSEYPKNINQNNLRYAKIAMETLAKMIKKKKKKQAGHLIVRTLRYNNQYSGLWVKMMRYFSIIVTVQQSYKIFRIKKANFKKLLLKLWDKYYFMGMEQTIEVKKSEENEQLFWRKKQNVLNVINSTEVKTYAIDNYFNDQMIDFQSNIGNYLSMIRHAPKEQRNKIIILQAFLNNEELYRKSEIFENYNEEQADEMDVSFENVGTDQAHKATNFIKKPRLFVVPTFKSIKSVFRRGVIYYASQNPTIMEKISLKEF